MNYRLEEWVTRPFSADWSHIVRGNFVEPQFATQAANDLLCFSKSARTAAIFAIVREGRLDDGTIVERGPKRIGTPTKLDRAWTHVASSSGQPVPRILFYDTYSGDGALYAVGPSGTMTQVGTRQFGAGWTHLVSGHFERGGYEFLFYNATTGVTRISSMDANGGFLGSFTDLTLMRNSALVVPGNFARRRPGEELPGEPDDLLYYNRATGVADFYRVGSSIQRIARHQDWRRTWRSIHAVRLRSTAFDSLLFVDMHTGASDAFVTDGAGGIAPISVVFPEAWRSRARNFRVVLPGTFIGTFQGGPDLCAYDPVGGTISVFGIAVHA